MKIATITIFCNEDFRLEAWKRYYMEYRGDIGLHVIVNNGRKEDTQLLKTAFPDSLVLESPTPNMMASYNMALREILKDPEVDAIAQIVNDIRLSEAGLSTLYGLLEADRGLFAVSPVLLGKDCDVIDCYGCEINHRNLDFVHLDSGRRISDLSDPMREVSGLPAGIFLARRSYYETLGFQDERLEMYADEIDMGLRVAAEGLKMAATTAVLAWHQHVNRGGKAVRSERAAFLMGRNPVYIARKYPRRFSVVRVYFRRMFRGLDEIRSAIMHRKTADHYRFGLALMKGATAGLRMKRVIGQE